MTDLEDALRRALGKQPRPTSTDEMLTRVEGTLRHRRHLLVGAAAAAVGIVVAAGATAVALHITGRHLLHPGQQHAAGQPDAVAWVNTPGNAARTSTPTSAVSAQCRAKQLSATQGPVGGGAGTLTQYITVTNRSASTCSLTGAPSSVTGTRRNGKIATVYQHPTPASAVRLSTPANLAPGQSAEFALSSSDMCAAAANPEAHAIQSLRFGVEGNSTVKVTIPDGEPLQLPCDIGFSAFGTPQQRSTPTEENPLDGLTVSATMPDTVTAGSTVVYQATLTNPTSRDVPLRPCPAYTEFLTPASTSPKAYSHTYELNCKGTSNKIPAHSSVTFRMHIPAPSATGQAKFGWTIPGAGVTTGRALTITSP